MPRDKQYHKPIEGTFDEVLTVIGQKDQPASRTIYAKPFLKWVGGKRSILHELESRLPNTFDTYYEPFLGGGALFFSIQPEDAYLSDINFHLIIAYKAIRDDVNGVIRELKKHQENHNKKYYLQQRKRLSLEANPVKIASILIYLNKTCFNGLYRVNKSNEFNVPIGDYKNPAILDEENLRNVSKVLQQAEIHQHGFEHVPVRKNGFYYLDPPYHQTYDGYNGNGFGDDMHVKLAEFCRKVDQKGGYFMQSNSDTPLVRQLYKGYNIDTVSASRSVSCKAHQRGKEDELIIRNYK